MARCVGMTCNIVALMSQFRQGWASWQLYYSTCVELNPPGGSRMRRLLLGWSRGTLMACVTPNITDLIPPARHQTCSNIFGHQREPHPRRHPKSSSAASLWRFSEWLHVWPTAQSPVYRLPRRERARALRIYAWDRTWDGLKRHTHDYMDLLHGCGRRRWNTGCKTNCVVSKSQQRDECETKCSSGGKVVGGRRGKGLGAGNNCNAQFLFGNESEHGHGHDWGRRDWVQEWAAV